MARKHYYTKYRRVFLTVLSLLLAGCGGLVKLQLNNQPPAAHAEDWLTAGGNIERHNVSAADILPPYNIKWKTRYKSVVADNPLATGNYIILSTINGMLAFFNAEDGQLLGDGHIAPAISHVPTLLDGILYYSANLGNESLGAFDVTRLKKVWEKKLRSLTTSPLYWDNKLFVGSDRGDFFCVNSNSGAEIWKFSSEHSILGNPALAEQKIYYGDIAGNLYCLDATSGLKIWEASLGDNIFTTPVVAGDKVFIGTTGGNFFAVGAASGKIIWSYKSAGSIYGSAAYSHGNVYFGNNNHRIFSLNGATGQENWVFKSEGINNSAPLVGPDFVYFGSWDRFFYVLDRMTGKLVYRQEFDKPIKSSPIIYQDKIYIHIANDKLYCLEHKKDNNAG